ncbi:TauD/TfdA dioxygenase family protein [Aquabacterium sp.]|uniref:TauD/TfdA dioxygenase family protein n=1 Tax=Aquabacterium sp. TaxID=1872578 RepID=UPI002BF066E4|nr:TauD/TfdA family dioxygenase [Aquabacterium sp.]HSW05198.1 TauD/TfdA family dioxygenase [Aquabacterium sp.]
MTAIAGTAAPIKTTQLGTTFVARLDGIDARQLRPGDKEAVVAALDRYGVVVMPGQSLDPIEQIYFSENFGPLERSSEGIPSLDQFKRTERLEDPRLSEITNLTEEKHVMATGDARRLYQYANRLWHTDSTFRPIRARYTYLRANQVPSEGGETEFADMVAAYEALPASLKHRLAGLQGVHTLNSAMDMLGATRADSGGFRTSYPDQVRPIVDVHPNTGRRVLCVPSHCSHIEGLPIPEGRSLLFHLRELATQREFVYRHAWTAGDMVIWDNRSTLHRAVYWEDNNAGRQMVRTLTQDVPEAR